MVLYGLKEIYSERLVFKISIKFPVKKFLKLLDQCYDVILYPYPDQVGDALITLGQHIM